MTPEEIERTGYYIPDVPPLMPNNMPLFWEIWNSKKELLTKTKKDSLKEVGSSGNDLKFLYDDANFEGMITWQKSDKYANLSTWKQNVVLDAPEMWQAYVDDLHERLPWYDCEVIVLWASIKPVLFHIDPFPLEPAPIAVRSLIYDDNPSPTFKLRHTGSGIVKHVPYTKDRNLFVFNNRNFFHGSDYNPGHYKILMKSFGLVKDKDAYLKQLNECYEKGLTWQAP